MQIEKDIVILGGGIAGLWLLNRLRNAGYAAVLLESTALGTGQRCDAERAQPTCPRSLDHSPE